MRILLISPPNKYSEETGPLERLPLGLAYIRASLLISLPEAEVRIIGEDVCFDVHKVLSTIEVFRPDIIGITVLTFIVDDVLSLVREIKGRNRDSILIAGGPHGYACPEELLGEDAFDAVMLGEGERTLPLIAKAINAKRALHSLPGVVTEKTLEKAPSYVNELDALPFPLGGKDNRSHNQYDFRGSAACVFTSRGCPYHCPHCIESLGPHRIVRLRSIPNVLAELEYLVKKRGVEFVIFGDSCFTIKPGRVIGLCEAIISSRLNFHWLCQTRPELLLGDQNEIDRMLGLMGEAGCIEVRLGIESSSETVLRGMGRRYSKQDIRQVVERTKSAGLSVLGLFMIGNLKDTRERVRETVRFAKALPLDWAVFTITCPLPGTELYATSLERGYLNSPRFWRRSPDNPGECAVLDYPELSAAEITALWKWAKKSYTWSPTRMLLKARGLIGRKGRLRRMIAVRNARARLRHILLASLWQ